MMTVHRARLYSRLAGALAVASLAIGTVHASPTAQAVSPMDILPSWAAAGSSAALVAFVLIALFNRSSRGSNEVLLKNADNEAEKIKLERERFEQQKLEDAERNRLEDRRIDASITDAEVRNANVTALIEQMKVASTRTDELQTLLNNDRNIMMTNLAVDMEAKRVLSDAVLAKAAEDARHNEETERRLHAIEQTMREVTMRISEVKSSIDENTFNKLHGIETSFNLLANEIRAFVTSLQPAPAPVAIAAVAVSVETEIEVKE